MKTSTFTTPGVCCQGCVSTVQKGLGSLPGVESVVADPETKKVEVGYDESQVNEQALRAKLSDVGYPADA